MAMVRKKEGDKYLEALRELITTGGGNRQCFDCGQKGPTYVNMTIGSFVCTRCSGVLRGITPPHRVKSISMATFTQDEIDFLKAHGNDVCAKTWLGLWDPKRAVHQDQRELMIDKYERKRYYLEPASPLKSLTNATNLKTNTAANNTTTTISSSSASSTNNSNSINSNSKTQIQLTPPTSQRTTANGLHKTSSTAISRPQHSVTTTQNGFSSSLNSHTTDAFGLHNGLNSSIGSMSTGALSDTSSCASANGFGAEADFVADFGSADIFNATVASSPASSVGSSTTNNGYAKIQPMKVTSAAHQQFMNGHNTSVQNGNLSNGNTENFADFDHAPIYNAAGLPINNNNNNKNSTTNGFINNNNNQNNINNNNNSSAPAEDRYAALKDLDEQLRESKAVAAQAASIVTANVVDSGFGNPNGAVVNPFAPTQQHPQTAVVVNPFQNASNNPTQNATQQLFGQMTLIPNGIAAANGFLNAQKTHTANTGFFNYTASGFTNANTPQIQQHQQQQQQQQHPSVATAAAASILYPTSIPTGPNGCGFGFGTLQQQIASTGTGLTTNTFNNPFAATGALNSNNPFL